MMHIVRMEIVRLLDWRRWAVAALMVAMAGGVTAYDLARQAQLRGFQVNQWDVVLDMLNNFVVVTFLLLPLFVGLIGDVVLRDRWSGFALLTLPRIGSRTRWWIGKLGAVWIAAVIYFVGMALVVTVVAVPFTGAAWPLSLYGQASPESVNFSVWWSKGYNPPPFTAVPLLGMLVIACYTALTTWALVALILAIAQWWPRAWVPLGLTIGVGLIFFRISPTNLFHPLIHLFWDLHNLSGKTYAVEWWASGLVISLEVVAAILVGTYLLQQYDI
jgi:hypothetical protein